MKFKLLNGEYGDEYERCIYSLIANSENDKSIPFKLFKRLIRIESIIGKNMQITAKGDL